MTLELDFALLLDFAELLEDFALLLDSFLLEEDWRSPPWWPCALDDESSSAVRPLEAGMTEEEDFADSLDFGVTLPEDFVLLLDLLSVPEQDEGLDPSLPLRMTLLEDESSPGTDKTTFIVIASCKNKEQAGECRGQYKSLPHSG